MSSICWRTMKWMISITAPRPSARHRAPGRIRRATTGCSAAPARPARADAADDAVPAHRLLGVARAAGVVLAGARRQRHHRLERHQHQAHRAHRPDHQRPHRADGLSDAERSSSADLLAEPAEALRVEHLVDAGAGDEHVVRGRLQQLLVAVHGLAKPSLHGIALDGAAHLARHGEADPGQGAALGLAEAQRQVAARDRTPEAGDRVELGGTGEAAASGRCRRGSRGFLGHVRDISGREALPPARTTPLEDGAASPGAHALAEAVGLGALAGVRLIRAFHGRRSV